MYVSYMYMYRHRQYVWCTCSCKINSSICLALNNRKYLTDLILHSISPMYIHRYIHTYMQHEHASRKVTFPVKSIRNYNTSAPFIPFNIQKITETKNDTLISAVWLCNTYNSSQLYKGSILVLLSWPIDTLCNQRTPANYYDNYKHP